MQVNVVAYLRTHEMQSQFGGHWTLHQQKLRLCLISKGCVLTQAIQFLPLMCFVCSKLHCNVSPYLIMSGVSGQPVFHPDT